MTQATLQYLGIVHWVYKKDALAADKWYAKCMEFNEDYFRCFMNRSELYTDLEKFDDAWNWGLEAVHRSERVPKGGRSSITHGHDKECKLPLHLLKVSLKLDTAKRPEVLDAMRILMASGVEHCPIDSEEEGTLRKVKARIDGAGTGVGKVEEKVEGKADEKAVGGWEGLGLSEKSITAVERMSVKERRLLWTTLGGKEEGYKTDASSLDLDFFTRIIVTRLGLQGEDGEEEECFAGSIGKIIQREWKKTNGKGKGEVIEVIRLYELHMREKERELGLDDGQPVQSEVRWREFLILLNSELKDLLVGGHIELIG